MSLPHILDVLRPLDAMYPLPTHVDPVGTQARRRYVTESTHARGLAACALRVMPRRTSRTYGAASRVHHVPFFFRPSPAGSTSPRHHTRSVCRHASETAQDTDTHTTRRHVDATARRTKILALASCIPPEQLSPARSSATPLSTLRSPHQPHPARPLVAPPPPPPPTALPRHHAWSGATTPGSKVRAHDHKIPQRTSLTACACTPYPSARSPRKLALVARATSSAHPRHRRAVEEKPARATVCIPKWACRCPRAAAGPRERTGTAAPALSPATSAPSTRKARAGERTPPTASTCKPYPLARSRDISQRLRRHPPPRSRNTGAQ
ncbi:hypothetical protein C8J57DRAFT_1579316 [Mycena rebaudengoi]|nr:hypothetical protein C8J57DRAFT_1579316 [Mycena rebaudengoi]